MTDIITNSMIQLFRTHYLKIVNVNLTHGTYSIIWLNDAAAPDKLEFKINMFKNRVKIEQTVHPNDVATLYRYCDREFLSKIIEDNHVIKIRYRQKSADDVYRWLELEIIPGLDYSSDNCSLILYYRDIDSDYARDYERHRLMEQAATKDHLTHINNRYSFDKFVATSNTAESIGLLYMDLNKLKYINDTQGHKAGDDYIKYFCKLMTLVFRSDDCYRIGGDEFVVVIKDISKEMFDDKVSQISKLNVESNSIYPLSSIGTYWSNKRPFNILRMVEIAEKGMYDNKKRIHELWATSHHI